MSDVCIVLKSGVFLWYVGVGHAIYNAIPFNFVLSRTYNARQKALSIPADKGLTL